MGDDWHDLGHELNHGSYGAAPLRVLAVQDSFRARQHANPDHFLGTELPALMSDARASVATLVCAAHEEITLVDNATTGAAVVAMFIASRFVSGEFEAGDRILVTRWMYDSCFKAFHHHCGTLGAQFVVADLPGPPLPSIDLVLEAFRRALASLSDPWTALDDRSGRSSSRFGAVAPHAHEVKPIRLVCLDHIASACPYILPLKEI